MPVRHIQKHRDSNALVNRGLCFYCRAPMGSKVTADHLIPKSKGGKSIKANIVAACWVCNKHKKNMSADEFFTSEKLKRIKKNRGVRS